MEITSEMWGILIGRLSSTATNTEAVLKISLEMNDNLKEIIKLLEGIKKLQTGIISTIATK